MRWLILSLALSLFSQAVFGGPAQSSDVCAARFDTALSDEDRQQVSGRAATAEDREFALALSGGGYRAMLFYAGSILKLNSAGLLPKIRVISSVSGGSITAGVLADAWSRLEWDEHVATNIEEVLVGPLMRVASKTIDLPSILTGLLPFTSSSDQLVDWYDQELFHRRPIAELSRQDTPLVDQKPSIKKPPLFIFNATSLQSGEIIHITPKAFGGEVIGWRRSDGVRLSEAVAASSAFPPMLGPVSLRLSDRESQLEWQTCISERPLFGIDIREAVQYASEDKRQDLRKKLLLVDGGVRDNLGLVAIDHINRIRLKVSTPGLDVLISDGGAAVVPELEPATNWISQGWRVIEIATSEPNEVRIEQMIRRSAQLDESSRDKDDAQRLEPDGTFWSIKRLPKHHVEFTPPLHEITAAEILSLSREGTRLGAIPPVVQERLIDWGYISRTLIGCGMDAGLRSSTLANFLSETL